MASPSEPGNVETTAAALIRASGEACHKEKRQWREQLQQRRSGEEARSGSRGCVIPKYSRKALLLAEAGAAQVQFIRSTKPWIVTEPAESES